MNNKETEYFEKFIEPIDKSIKNDKNKYIKYSTTYKYINNDDENIEITIKPTINEIEIWNWSSNAHIVINLTYFKKILMDEISNGL